MYIPALLAHPSRIEIAPPPRKDAIALALVCVWHVACTLQPDPRVVEILPRTKGAHPGSLSLAIVTSQLAAWKQSEPWRSPFSSSSALPPKLPSCFFYSSPTPTTISRISCDNRLTVRTFAQFLSVNPKGFLPCRIKQEGPRQF